MLKYFKEAPLSRSIYMHASFTNLPKFSDTWRWNLIFQSLKGLANTQKNKTKNQKTTPPQPINQLTNRAPTFSMTSWELYLLLLFLRLISKFPVFVQFDQVPYIPLLKKISTQVIVQTISSVLGFFFFLTFYLEIVSNLKKSSKTKKSIKKTLSLCLGPPRTLIF